MSRSAKQVIAARVPPATRHLVEAAATARGVTISEWARERLEEAARRDLASLAEDGGADTEDPGLGAFVRARRPDL